MAGFEALGILALGELPLTAEQIASATRTPADDRAKKRRQVIYLAPPQEREKVLEQVKDEIEAEREEAKRHERQARAKVRRLKAQSEAAEAFADQIEALALAEQQRVEATRVFKALEAELNFILHEIARLELEAKRRRDDEAMAVLMLSAL